MISTTILKVLDFKPLSVQHPNSWVGHLPFSYWLMQDIKPNIFVELGTHSGNSYFSFCQSAKEENLTSKCYAVDTWHGDEHAGKYSEEVFHQVNSHNQEYYGGFSRLLRMTFDEAKDYFSDGSIELLHIDGLHTYEAVKHDFENWLPKLAPGAVVLFHDTNVRERGFGVWKLWEELQLSYTNTIEFKHSHGLGVLQFNNAPPSKQICLFSADSTKKQQIINFFSNLGVRQLERYELSEFKQNLANLYKVIGDRDGHIASLNQAVTERDGHIASLNQAVTERDGQIVFLGQSITDKDTQISSLDRQVESKHQTIIEICGSRSWRITKPIRLLAGRLRKYKYTNVIRLAHKAYLTYKNEGIYHLFVKCYRYYCKANYKSTYNYSNYIEYNAHLSRIVDQYISSVTSKYPIYIVIPSYNDFKYITKCVESINKFCIGTVNKIVITDDASPSDEHIRNLHKIKQSSKIDIILVLNKVNSGFSTNVNKGLGAIKEKADVLLINSDIEFTEHAIEHLFYYAHINNAIVGCRLLYPDNTVQHGGGFRNFNHLDWFDHKYRGRGHDYLPSLLTSNVLYSTGAALYIPHSVRMQLGSFDENFKMGFEDVDYCLRAWENNIPVIYCGSATLIHHESATRGITQGTRELNSKDYFWKKYSNLLNKRIIYNAKNQIHVIFVIQDNGVGGGHRVIFNFANSLSEKGKLVEIWSIALQAKPDWFEFNENIIFKKFNNFSDLENELSQADAIKIATWWKTADIVWRASLQKGIPVYLVQDIETSYYKNRDIENELGVITTYKPEFIYLVNYKWITSYFTDELMYHHNYIGLGVDSDKFYFTNSPKISKSILVCARGESIKGFEYSKTIIKQLIPLGYKVFAYGVDISLVADLPEIEFTYKPSNELLNKLYNQSEFFLQTSIHEGLSLPPLEAMSCRCIPIVTNACGNMDYVRNADNCILLSRDLNDDVKSITSKHYGELIHHMLPYFQNTLNEYSWASCFNRLDDIIKNIAITPVYGKTYFK